MEYVRGFGSELGETLFHDLGVTGPDAKELCAKYIAESREITAKRESLTAKLTRFRDARRAIEDWQAGH